MPSPSLSIDVVSHQGRSWAGSGTATLDDDRGKETRMTRMAAVTDLTPA